MSKKIISVILVLLMLVSITISAASALSIEVGVDFEWQCGEDKDYTVTKISNPDRGEREVDGLIAGGDRENSYTWRLAMRGDEIYVATTRNIASALVNMYGSAFSQAGISLDTFWAMINAVTNGDIPRNDANEGANIISYNRKTGEFKVIYTAGKGDYFRMAVTFGDDVYFGSYSAVPTNPQYILKLDSEGNFTKVFQTMNSVSLRANCEYDGHLFFAGADDRELTVEAEEAPIARMAVLRKSNEDDTVWERVADYKDFGVIPYDSIMTSWAGAPIWELANHNGYIYATAPSTNGFVMYKGHPAADGEEANEYGWHWEEVVGLNNGINNPGISEKEGGEPGTMRSLIGSVYEFNGELYAYNFDHSFGGEASAFAGMLQQVAGKDVKASEYLFYMYDSLHNPQKIWKLNDVTGKFEECKEFTKLVDGTTNEYVWRLGEYDGDLYIATMDAGIFYNYMTQLTNGSFLTMTKEEKIQKIGYINELLKIIGQSKGKEKLAQLTAKLEQIKQFLENYDPSAMIDAEMAVELQNFGELIMQFKAAYGDIKDILDQNAEDIAAFFTYDYKDDEPVGAIDDSTELGLSLIPQKYQDMFKESAQQLKETLSPENVKAKIAEDIKKFYQDTIGKYVNKAVEIYNKIDFKGIEMYLYINNAVMKDDWGFDMYRTSDGETFETISTNGFGDKYNYGCPSFLATDEGLYFGTCNPFYGGQLWLLTNNKEEPATEQPTEEPAPTIEPTTEPGGEIVYGDVNGDGIVDILDSIMIQKYTSGKTEFTPEQIAAADYNRDGNVDILDASAIQRDSASS